jgi:hypothetical protein
LIRAGVKTSRLLVGKPSHAPHLSSSAILSSELVTQFRYLKAVHTRQLHSCGTANREKGANRGTMARKSTPQPLTLQNPIAHDEHNFIDNSKSPLSTTSPKSPRSPFKFTSSKISQGEQPSMQAAEPLQNRANLPTSQTSPSLLPLQQYSGDSGGQERQERERPARGGFFSNYKASKSSSRLQPSDTVRQVGEDKMSRDTDHPAMSGKVSPQETTRTGTTALVSSLQMSFTNC